MAKGQSKLLLDRWLDLDKALASGAGLYVEEFAESWGVSKTTVYRDLRRFEALGLRPRYARGWGGTRWHYEGKPRSLFVKAVRDRAEGRYEAPPLSVLRRNKQPRRRRRS
jgi:predicted transcriptional regulator